jgi:4-hydroxy-4-methyl-2-oxoglutarate aldolase
MKPVVVRNIKRATATQSERSARSASPQRTKLSDGQLMKPLYAADLGRRADCGPAVTVLAQPGDNWMIHVAVEQCQ